MPTDRSTLEAMDREGLIARAEADGVPQAKVLTRPELIDEILRREPGRSTDDVRRARGFLGLARDLLARVVERGLHLADAADRIRGGDPVARKPPPTALPTVTLAEIYATQGHKQKSIDTLNQVLAAEPEHAAARALLSKLEEGKLAVPKEPVLPPESDEPMGSSFMETSTIGPPAEPATMLDSEPLPTIYDVDECIAMNVDPTTLYVYWEIRDETFAHLRTRMPGGSVALRVLVMVPEWDGPRASVVDITVGNAVGDWFVRDLPEGAVLRASVGYKSRDGLFVSAAHSRGVEPTRRDRAVAVAQWLARWTPEATVSVGHAEPEAQKLARALARIEARRQAREERGESLDRLDAADLPLGRPLGASERLARPFGSSERLVASSWS